MYVFGFVSYTRVISGRTEYAYIYIYTHTFNIFYTEEAALLAGISVCLILIFKLRGAVMKTVFFVSTTQWVRFKYNILIYILYMYNDITMSLAMPFVRKIKLYEK